MHRLLRISSLVILAALGSFSITSCTSDADEQRMSEAYGQILLVREQGADSATANRKVDSIITAHGYTRAGFHDEFIRLTRSSESFRKMMDSVHSRLQRHDIH